MQGEVVYMGQFPLKKIALLKTLPKTANEAKTIAELVLLVRKAIFPEVLSNGWVCATLLNWEKRVVKIGNLVGDEDIPFGSWQVTRKVKSGCTRWWIRKVNL